MGARRVGEGGGIRGVGQGGKGGGIYIKIKFSTKQVLLLQIRVSQLTLQHEIVHKIAGNPRFLGESPYNDITFSKTHHNLTKKVQK